MGDLIDRRQWERGPGKDCRKLIDALQREVGRRSYSIQHRRWFRSGRSGYPVASVIRRDPGVDHRILKFCSDRQAQQLRAALSVRNRFAERHMADVDRETIRLGGDTCAVFMRVAGDNIEALRTMETLRAEGRALDYRRIVRSVLAEWNDDEPALVPRTVRSVVGGIVGFRRGDALRWIRRARDLRDLGPVSFLAGDIGRYLVPELLVGNAHGDLSSRNILVPAVPAIKSGGFQLIDYDHFTPDAPLARDPMHLLVKLAIDDYDERRSARADLIKAIVDPYQPGISCKIEDFRAMSAEIHEACASSFPRSKALAGHWTEQCLLALVGVALRRVGGGPRTEHPEEVRVWCYDLAVAAAQRFLEKYTGPGARAPETAVGAARPVIVGRYFEREALTDRLEHGPHGVMSVQGKRGVGKSRLVDAVLHDLGGRHGDQPPPRVHRHHATADRRLDLHTLAELIGGKRAPESSGSALVLFETVLKEIRDTPVVVAVESAENLLDARTRRVDDPELADAFDMLNSERKHRVSVVLETRHGAVLQTAQSWPDDDTVAVAGLKQHDFLAVLREMHPRMGRELDDLTPAQRRRLWKDAEGNPHVAELVAATVCEASVLTLPELLADLHANRHRPAAYLIEVLLGGMSPAGRDVMHALAVFRTPVPVEAVTDVLERVAAGSTPSQLRQSLKNLVGGRLVRRQGELCHLSPADAAIVLEQIPEAQRSDLLFAAVEVLKRLRVRQPCSTDDLRYHFAGIECMLDAGEHRAALVMADRMDDHLEKWNCSTLLRRQRERIRVGLEDPELVRQNENALGGIYVQLGKIGLANAAYGRALRRAGPDAEPDVLSRLHINLAGMHWAANNTDMAQSHYEYAHEKAVQAGDRAAEMGSLAGLAECLHRRGEFPAAITHAVEGFDISGSDGFAETGAKGISLAVGLAVRLSRWHAEQDRMAAAGDWLEKARVFTGGDRDRGHAGYLDGLADLRLAASLAGEPADGAVEEAVARAEDAVDLAHQTQDDAIMLKARTTLCVAHLRAGRDRKAVREITRADRYRAPGRHLVVLALLGLTARLTGDHAAAGGHFDELWEGAEERISLDLGVRVTIGTRRRIDGAPGDFSARYLQGFAQCGLALEGRGDVTAAARSFRMTDLPRRPHAPGLVTRLEFLLKRLDRSGARPGLLRPAIDALRDA